MKKNLLACLLVANIAFGQSYQLLPDSCTYCFYLKANTASSWENKFYSIDPQSDTLINGFTYLHFSNSQFFRQAGNKLFCLLSDSIEEQTVMDFDAEVGDTLYQLYSDSLFYNAVIVNKDSIEIADGTFHHFAELNGFSILINNVWESYNWHIIWHEKGLCGYDYGGFVFNIPVNDFVTLPIYSSPGYCTTDPIYFSNPSYGTCYNCHPKTNALGEQTAVKLKIYPTPCHEVLHIQSEGDDEKFIQVYDLTGQLLLQQHTFSQNSDLSVEELTNGLYLIEYRSNNKVSVYSFIKE